MDNTKRSNQPSQADQLGEEFLSAEAGIIVRHLKDNHVEVTLEEAMLALKEKEGNREEAIEHVQMKK